MLPTHLTNGSRPPANSSAPLCVVAKNSTLMLSACKHYGVPTVVCSRGVFSVAGLSHSRVTVRFV